MEVTTTRTRPDGGTRSKEWEYDRDTHCPSCGEKTVFIECNDGDYYEGPSHICINCSTYFTMPNLMDINSDDDWHGSELRQLQAAFVLRRSELP